MAAPLKLGKMLHIMNLTKPAVTMCIQRVTPTAIRTCNFSVYRNTTQNKLFNHVLNKTGYTGTANSFMLRSFVSMSSRTLNNSFQKLNTFGWCRTEIFQRGAKDISKQINKSNRTGLLYITSMAIFMMGMAYAGVPLYRMFCQATGSGGSATQSQGHNSDQVEFMRPVKERILKIKFNADIAASMRWNFRPQQSEVKVLPGETALAFYTATNPTDKPIIGISTYNVIPYEAGQYFNKIQCFCFEEQRLNPHEKVDMPVFFYIDPEFAEDPRLENTHTITLSYTFFEAKEGLQIPLPGYMQNPA